MDIKLTSVKCITSKKNGKDYLVYTLLCENSIIITCFIEYNGETENALISLLWEDVSSYIKFHLDKKYACYRPYIDIK